MKFTHLPQPLLAVDLATIAVLLQDLQHVSGGSLPDLHSSLSVSRLNMKWRN
jgi:hypothetical protein